MAGGLLSCFSDNAFAQKITRHAGFLFQHGVEERLEQLHAPLCLLVPRGGYRFVSEYERLQFRIHSGKNRFNTCAAFSSERLGSWNVWYAPSNCRMRT